MVVFAREIRGTCLRYKTGRVRGEKEETNIRDRTSETGKKNFIYKFPEDGVAEGANLVFLDCPRGKHPCSSLILTHRPTPRVHVSFLNCSKRRQQFFPFLIFILASSLSWTTFSPFHCDRAENVL